MRKLARGAVAILVVGGALGCSLALSLDDLGGGSPQGAAGAGDAAVDAPPSTPTDPPFAEGGEARDGAVAPVDGGDACQAGAVFCDAFERAATDVKGAWTEMRQAPGTLRLVPDARGNALDVDLPARSDVDNGYAAMYARTDADGTALGGASSRYVRYAYRLKVTPTASSGHYELMEAILRKDDATYSNFFLVLDGAAVSLAESTHASSGRKLEFHSLPPIADDAWHHLVVEVDATAPAPALPKIRVTVDGTLRVDELATTGVQGGALQIAAGITWAKRPWPALRFRVDDVSVVARP